MSFGQVGSQQSNIQIEKLDILPMSVRITTVGWDKLFPHKHPEMMEYAGDGAGPTSAGTHNDNRLKYIRFVLHS
jgi:hypothetical protein